MQLSDPISYYSEFELNGEDLPERSTFLSLKVHKRVGISRVGGAFQNISSSLTGGQSIN